MTRIFVPQPIPELALKRLRALGEVTVFAHLDRGITRSEVLEAVVDHDILFALGGIPYDREVLDATPGLRMIGVMHTSADFVDVALATARGIPVSGIPNLLATTTAEYTLTLLLATAWRVPEADRFLRDGRWTQRQSMALLGTRVMGKTLGIVGAGAIGKTVARLAAPFEMRILYTQRTRLPPETETALALTYRTLEELFSGSDFVVLTLALTEQTRGLVGERLLGLMKPEAILINTSRGAVVDEGALERCLREGRIRGAGLDVFEHEVGAERVGPSPGLTDLPNTVLTPHIGSAARETREAMAGRVVDNIEAFLTGGRPADILNPEIYAGDVHPAA